MNPSNADCALLFEADENDRLKIIGKRVPLVRCKDCKNRECVHDPVTGEIRNDMFFCKIVGYSSRFEFFCGDGKRKDDKNK